MEYHGATEKNVRTDCIDMGGDHEILIGKKHIGKNTNLYVNSYMCIQKILQYSAKYKNKRGDPVESGFEGRK